MDTNLEQNQSEHLKTKTLLDDYDNQDYVIIPTGKGYVDTFIINGLIPTHKRHRTLKAIAVANIYNNPTVAEPNLLARLLNINKDFCKPPFSYFEVLSIHNEIYNLHLEGKLILNFKYKYIWFYPDSLLTKEEKLSICAIEGAKMRAAATKAKIKEAIETLHSQKKIIRQKDIAKLIDKTPKTVKKYWPEFKSKVKEYNCITKENQNK